MHSSLGLSALSRFLESPAPSHTHFPVLDSPATSIPWPGASLAGKKCSCSGGDLPPGARHAPLAQSEPPSVKSD